MSREAEKQMRYRPTNQRTDIVTKNALNEHNSIYSWNLLVLRQKIAVMLKSIMQESGLGTRVRNLLLKSMLKTVF